MKKLVNIQIVLVILILVPILLNAQPTSNPYDFGGGDPASVPIDGGLSILLTAGVGFGAKKLNEKNRK